MTAPAGSRSIVVDQDLPHPPEKVWRALAESELLGRWLMANDLRPVKGHRFTFRAQPAPGWDGVVHCEVLDVEPHELLRYSWRGGSDAAQGYGARLDSVVTWTLEPSLEGGTKLHLEHAGFGPANAFAFEAMGKGWRNNVPRQLAQVLAALD